MRELLLILRDIFLFKRGPQDLPHAPNLAAVAVAVAIVIELVVNTFADKSMTAMLPRVVVWHLVPIGLLYLLLHARSFNSRFVQTLLAQALTSCVVLALAAPLMFVLGDFNPQSPQVLRPGQALAGLLLLVIAIWKLGVLAHILRQALEVPFFAGVLITILVGVANVIVQAALFGERVGAAGVGV